MRNANSDQVVFPAWLNSKENPEVLVASAKEVRRANAVGLESPVIRAK